MLDHETTLMLIEKAKNDDNEAKTLLITNNMPLIKSIARRYRNQKIDYEDLLQLGSMGFIKAIKNFDATFNVRFSTYAVPMIAGEIKRFIRDDGAIKVSRVLKTLNCKIQAFVSSYNQTYQRAPSIAELAKEFAVDEQEIVYAMDSNKYPVSLFEKFDDENGQTVMDKLPSNENSDDIVDKILLKDIISSLPKREKEIIILRYYRDKTQSEIAQLLGVSQVQISRIENKILKEMRIKLA